MMVVINGGFHASVQPPLRILKNKYRSYPVLCVPYNVPGALYLTSPNACMDSTALEQWLKE